MNDQCHNCKVRKWCYEPEPIEDWTCEYYKSDSEYVDFLDDCLSEEDKQKLYGYKWGSKYDS